MSDGARSHSTVATVRGRLLRAGLAILGVGFLLALIAAVVIGRRWTAWESAASAVHRVGLVVMLIGFCLVLVSYRVPQIMGLLQPEASVGRGSAGHPLSPLTRRTVWGPLERILPAALGVAMVAVFVLPRPLGLLLAFSVSLLVPPILIAVVICTNDWRRAFCLGAISPALMSLCAATMLLLLGIFELTRSWGSPWQVIAEFAFTVRLFVVGCWLLMFMTGAIAVVIYFLLRPYLEGQTGRGPWGQQEVIASLARDASDGSRPFGQGEPRRP